MYSDNQPTWGDVDAKSGAALLSALEERHPDLAVPAHFDSGQWLTGTRQPSAVIVTRGIAALPCPRTGVLVGLASEGDLLGAEQVHGGVFPAAMALVAGEGVRLDLTAGADRLGPDTIGRAASRALLERQAFLEREVVCNALHGATGRLSKLLLELADRSGESRLMLTQLRLSALLGIQRTSVNAAVAYLQARGALRVRRGKIELLSLDVLRQMSCGCEDLRKVGYSTQEPGGSSASMQAVTSRMRGQE